MPGPVLLIWGLWTFEGFWESSQCKLWEAGCVGKPWEVEACQRLHPQDRAALAPTPPTLTLKPVLYAPGAFQAAAPGLELRAGSLCGV